MREVTLLNELDKCDSYLSLDYLSSVLKVGKRSVLNDIKAINKTSIHNGFEIKNIRGKGYYLKKYDVEKFAKYLKSFEQSELIVVDRIPSILGIMLFESDFITQEYIADYLGVSKSIIRIDMDKIANLLAKNNIKMERKAHYGVKLKLSGYQRKEAIRYYYDEQNDYVVEIINHVIHTNIQEVEKALIKILNDKNLCTNYIELRQIDTFIKACIYSSMYGLSDDEINDEISSDFIAIADSLNKVIEKHFQMSLSKQDLYDLAIYIKQKTKVKESKLAYNDGLEEMVDRIFEEFDKEYNMNFKDDKEFRISLLSHVSLLLDRLHQSITFSNPMVNEISVKYPVNFNIAIRFVQEIEKTFHVQITNDEIGFIATHFAAHMEREASKVLGSFQKIAIVCSTGGGSALLIKFKLESLFEGRNIKTFSLLEEEQLKDYHPDIIFTITDLYNDYDVPIIKIKELLDDNDILKIKNMFNIGNDNLIEKSNQLLSLMRKDCFFIYKEDTEYYKVVKEMAKNVEKLDLADTGFADNVLVREEYLSTIYDNGIAIPHSVNNYAKEDVVSIGLIKGKLDKSVKIIFLVNLSVENLNILKEITRILFEIMENPENVKFLWESESFDDFTRKLHVLEK